MFVVSFGDLLSKVIATRRDVHIPKQTLIEDKKVIAAGNPVLKLLRVHCCQHKSTLCNVSLVIPNTEISRNLKKVFIK